ncbi:MAG: GNAT family N-acetyltransferase, partial [Salibacteraceae bacterium]|nr:GNAT family N-acetyltransferase [Salibacteraceae bacterium]
MKSDYLFTTQRLGFRNWKEEDIPEFAAINSDEDVMEHFPKTLTIQETTAFVERLQNHFEQFGYTYFAVEVLETDELIGFIGLTYQDFEAEFTPATDIGWRLKKSAWGKGYATEGARRCLEFAFHDLKLKRIVSIRTESNSKSENVMSKIGLRKKGT